MANNYLKHSPNHFDLNNDDLEDVDDEIFLNNSRSNSSLSGAGSLPSNGHIARHSSNPFEDQQQIYLDKRRQIEERALQSTKKSLRLLYETEDVGNATALELAKQREQLEKSSRQMDEINSSLRFSQRHLNGLKSVFGGLKNYLSGNRDLQSPRMNSSPSESHNSEGKGFASTSSNSSSQFMTGATPINQGTGHEPSHAQQSVNSIRSTTSVSRKQPDMQQQLQRRNPFEAQLESNLESMCDNLSRLKFLATDLNAEIESQNELLDNMNYKIEDIDLKMTKQNKEMNKLLGKK